MTVTLIGLAGIDGGTATQSHSFTLTSGASVGHTVVVFVNNPAATDGTFTIGDSKGNVWDASVTEKATPGSWRMVAATSKLATALTPSDTITVSVGSTDGFGRGWCFVAVDLGAVGSRDVYATTASSGTALSVGPTAVASAADQTVFGVFAYTGQTRPFTAGSNFTAVTSVQGTNGTSYYNLSVESADVSTAGTRSADGTISSTTGWGGIVMAINTVPNSSPSPVPAGWREVRLFAPGS